MKKYPAYKDSGIEWIGEIPEGWDCIPIKRKARINRGASPRPIDDPKYFDEDGEFAWVRIADVTASEKYLENTTQILSELGSSLSVKRYPGDLFLSIAGTVGKPIITKIKCCIHDGFVYFQNLKIDDVFLYYIFLGGEAYKGLGKWGTQLNLNTETIGSIHIPLPPDLKGQQAIANFLDQKTSAIDTLVDKKTRQIELLKEYRTAVINHAVTKGLDPDARMKDSGIEWIGEIPEGWEVVKLKRNVSTPVTDGPHETPTLVDVGIPFASAEAIKNSKIDFNYVRGYITLEDHEKYSKKCKPKKNDILLIKSGATTGELAIVETDKEFNIWSPLALIRTDENYGVPKYNFYFLKSEAFKISVVLNWNYGTQQNIGMKVIENLYIVRPPLPEQQAIAGYLDRKT